MRRGFTLLELIIVIIILAILASLALPRFISTTERARAAEALANLAALRGAMDRYWVQNDRSYVGASMTNAADCGAAAYNLDLDCPNTNVNKLFDYRLGALAANTYSIIATRLAVRGGTAGDSITIDDAGKIVGTGAFTSIK